MSNIFVHGDNYSLHDLIKCIHNDIDAGYYYIIDDFCNFSKIKQALEKVAKQSKTNNKFIHHQLRKYLSTYIPLSLLETIILVPFQLDFLLRMIINWK